MSFLEKLNRACLCVGATVVVITIAGCDSGGPAFEYLHLPGTAPAAGANMPYSSAMKVTSGSILFLSGTSGAPVPHSHPHDPREFDHLDFGAEAQAERVMERIKLTVEAAGGDITDVIQVTRFIVDIAANQDQINEVMNRYWGPDHRPATTSVEIVRVAADSRFILEVEAVAVIPD